VQLIIKDVLQSRAAYIFLFLYLFERIMCDAESFNGYILSTKLSLRILLSSESYAHSITGGIMMNRKQL